MYLLEKDTQSITQSIIEYQRKRSLKFWCWLLWILFVTNVARRHRYQPGWIETNFGKL
jgi:hypothetical protein